MKLKHFALLLFIVAGNLGYSQSSVFVFNEYSCSNVGIFLDPLGGSAPSGSPDWVEIRNTVTTHSLQTLSGWYISDERYNLHKWQFPYFANTPMKMDSGECQTIFLCGHDKAIPGTVGVDTFTVNGNTRVGLHANFQINQTKKGGAVLYLTKINTNIPADSVHIKITQPNHSWGRCWEKKYPTVTGNTNTGYWVNNVWRLYTTPTPGKFNPKWPFYYTDYLPKPKFDIVPGYYSTLGQITISDSSNLSNTVGGYVNYSSVYIVATNDCTLPDSVNTINPGTALIVDQGKTLGSPLGNPFTIATSTLIPAPTGYMMRAKMHDGSLMGPTTGTLVNTYSTTPRYYDSFEAYGAYYDTLYKMGVSCVCIDTTQLFITQTQDTIITTLFDYFDKSGKELMRNQGQGMINKIDFFNPIGLQIRKQWQFNFRAEDEYGYNYSNLYQFYKDPVIGSSKRADFPELIFRSAGEENFVQPGGMGSQYEAAHIRDFFNHTMSTRHNLHYENSHYVPTYMLVNGNSRGIYYIKEPFDSTYTDYYFNRPKAAILSNGIVSGGTPAAYTQFYSNVIAGFGSANNAGLHWATFYSWAMQNNTNVHIPALFNELADSLDFLSLNDYTIYNMLSVNSDYLNRSAIWWKGLPTDTADHRASKWRFGLANTDLTWGFSPANYNNISNQTATSDPCDFITAFGLTWPPASYTPPNAQYPIMALWLKLMDNDTFRSDFLSRYSDLLNGALSCDSLTDHLKYIRTLLAQTDMNSHVYGLLYDQNFPLEDSVRYWNAAMDSMKVFITQRCSLVNNGLKNCFSLNGPFNLCVDVSPSGTGYVTLNTLTLNKFIWNGKYFDSVTMIAKAIPYQNYVFDHWETTPTSYTLNPNNKSDSINFFVSRDQCIKAVFKLKPAYETTGTPMIPTGFSPNGDDNNDIFNIYGINDASNYELEVYNRWGEMIFRSTDKTQGWDGIYNGVPVPVGVYAYRYNIIMGGKTYKSKGSVTLLR